MSWMAVNNAPLLGTGATDISGLSEGFRDGQKLRQEYEARQQQKALNEIMKVGDHNGRLELAQQHKYAGALVPQLQKYEEDRQKAALDNLKTSADIGKVYGETGKLGAETGKIGAETGGQVLKNVGDTQNQISALAVTQNPKLFALGIGEMVKQKLISPERADMMFKMIDTDQPNAAAVLQAMVMANPELAKLFQPKTEVVDTGDAKTLHTVDPFTGQYSEPYRKLTLGQTPDNKADNITRRYVSDNSLEGTKYSSDNTYEASVYGTDVHSADTRYGTDVRAKTASDAQAADWYVKNTQLGINQQNADTAEAKAKPVVATAGQARKLEANERTQLFEMEENISADKAVIASLKSMLALADKTNSGFAAAGRAKGWSNIGLASQKDNDTVLFDNMATEQGLKQLKSTFGAAPTEGERKILMDIQASASKTPAQKKAIINNAIKAAEVRMAHRQAVAEGIRTGQYMIPKGTQTKQPATKKTAAKPKAKAKETAGQSIIGSTLGGR